MSQEDVETLRKGMEAFNGRDVETLAAISDEDLEIFDADSDCIVAVFRLVGRGIESGAPVEQSIGGVYRFRAGKVWRAHAYLDPRQAFEAAGWSGSGDASGQRGCRAAEVALSLRHAPGSRAVPRSCCSSAR